LQPPNVLGALEAGGRLGLSAHEVEVNAMLRRAEMAQRAGEVGAAQSLRQNALDLREREMAERQNATEASEALRRDQLGLTGERLAETEKQNAAVDALRQSQMEETAKHNAETFGLREKQLADKTTPADFVTFTSGDATTGRTETKLSKAETAAYSKAHKAWEDNTPPETIKVPGKIWGQNEVPNPALDAYKQTEPQPMDFLMPAASGLTAGTGTAAPAAAAPPAAAALSAAQSQLPDFGPTVASPNLPTATNPKTGEKLVFKDNQWQPIPQQ